MTKYMAMFCLLLLAPGILCFEAIANSWALKDARASLEAEAAQLAPILITINADMNVKEQNRTSYQADLQLVERLLWKKANSINLFSCFSSSECKKQEDNKKRAMELLVSLRSRVRVCDLDSVLAFLKFVFALEKSKITQVQRILLIVYGYLDEHFGTCRDLQRKNYYNLVSTSLNAPQRQVMRRLVSLDGITLFDFARFTDREKECESMSCQRQRLLAMPDFEIKRDAAKALKKIELAIDEQLTRDYYPNSMRAADDEKLKETLNQYLFEPCELLQSNQKLAAVLQPALIMAAYDSSSIGGYFPEYPEYFRAIFNYGLCGKLLEEREHLYGEFFAIWRRIAPEEPDS